MRQIQTKCLACRKAADSILDMPQPLFTFPVKLAGYRRFLWVYSFCSCGKSEKCAIFLQISQHNDKPANIICNRSSCQLHSACEILLLLKQHVHRRSHLRIERDCMYPVPATSCKNSILMHPGCTGILLGLSRNDACAFLRCLACSRAAIRVYHCR